MNLLQHEYDKLDTLTDGAVLQAEAKRLETLLLAELLRLDNETQIKLFLKTHLNRLVALCNSRYDADAPANPDAEAILRVMDALRTAVPDMLPDDAVLPELFRDRQAREACARWEQLRHALTDMGINETLLDIMERPPQRFADKGKPARWLAFRYLQKYLNGLEVLPAMGVLDDRLVWERLIGLGYNHPRLASHITRTIRATANRLDPRERLAYLQDMRKRVVQVHRFTVLRFARNMPPIAEELVRWLDEEAGSPPATGTPLPNEVKLNTRFKVTQLALWQKLLYDHGVYDEANLDLFSEKVARCFSTRGQASLSPVSIKSKFYSKDPADIRALKQLVDDLRDDLGNFM